MQAIAVGTEGHARDTPASVAFEREDFHGRGGVPNSDSQFRADRRDSLAVRTEGHGPIIVAGADRAMSHAASAGGLPRGRRHAFRNWG